MLTAADRLHKSVVLMLCATAPGEVLAARDAALRLARCGPHELAQAIAAPQSYRSEKAREMIDALLGWDKIGISLMESERRFIRSVDHRSTFTSAQADLLEKIYDRIFGEKKEYA